MSTNSLSQLYSQEYDKNMSYLISGYSAFQQKVASFLPKSKMQRKVIYSLLGVCAVLSFLFVSMDSAFATETIKDKTQDVVDKWMPDAQAAMFLIMMGLMTLGILVSVYGVIRSLFR